MEALLDEVEALLDEVGALLEEVEEKVEMVNGEEEGEWCGPQQGLGGKRKVDRAFQCL